MTEKDFLKQLNSEFNKDGLNTIKYMKEYLKSINMPAKKTNIFRRTYEMFIPSKNPVNVVKDHFLYILHKTNPEMRTYLLIDIMLDNRLKDLTQKYFSEILRTLNKDRDNKKEVDRFLYEFMTNFEDSNEFMIENIEKLIYSLDPYLLFDNISRVKNLSEETNARLELELEKKKFEICKEMIKENIKGAFQKEIYVDERDFEDYSKTLAIMIDELLESENKKWIDIRKIGRGGFSSVYKIGDKVLKVGGTRTTYKMPNHRRILQPLIRTNLTTKRTNEVFGCIEIADEVTTKINPRKNNNEEKFYEMYREIRDSGIRWTDVQWGNVGILKKHNTPTLGGEPFKVNPDSVGFDKEVDDVLGEGELVVLDSDFFYKNGVALDEMYLGSVEQHDKFESRYRKERARRDSSTLTREQVKDLILEYKTEEIETEIALVIAEFATMDNNEFKNFLNNHKNIGKVEDYIIDEIFKKSLTERDFSRFSKDEKNGDERE